MRLLVIADSLDEGWPSMDLSADELVRALEENERDIEVEMIRLPIASLARRLGTHPGLFTIDRALTRYLRYALSCRGRFDAYHIVDHSYAHLACLLPFGRTGVYVHDLDAFEQALGSDGGERRLLRSLFSGMSLAGVRRCAAVFYSTQQVLERAMNRGYFATPTVEAPLGVAREFVVHGEVGHPSFPSSTRYVLHVGSALPRRRIDRLLRAFALLREQDPNLRLVQRGGDVRARFSELVRELRLDPWLIELPPVSRNELASLYRGASAVMLSSDDEGFGIPLIEALACGTPVAATDISAFREVGGDVVHRSKGLTPEALAEATRIAIAEGRQEAAVLRRREWSDRFSWSRHASIIAETYRRLCRGTERV